MGHIRLIDDFGRPLFFNGATFTIQKSARVLMTKWDALLVMASEGGTYVPEVRL